MSVLNLISQTIAYDDACTTSNPKQKYVDWKHETTAVAVENPKAERFRVDPGAELLVFDGSRTLTMDNTTVFSLSTSITSNTRYRVTWTGGTNPGLRTARALSLVASTLTIVINANYSITVTGASFAVVQVGDTILIPGTVTGDPVSPFNASNTGYWTAIGVTPTSVTLARFPGEPFFAYGESVLITAASQFVAYSASGIQINDKVELISGFSSPALKTYIVVGVSSTWFEIESTTPLAPEIGVIPGASGIKFYINAKRYIRVEPDQECVVRVNGDTGFTNTVSPWEPSDKSLVGEFTKTGRTWKLTVLNMTTVSLNLLVISAE